MLFLVRLEEGKKHTPEVAWNPVEFNESNEFANDVCADVCVCVRAFRHRMKFAKIIGRNTYLILKLQSQRIE